MTLQRQLCRVLRVAAAVCATFQRTHRSISGEKAKSSSISVENGFRDELCIHCLRDVFMATIARRHILAGGKYAAKVSLRSLQSRFSSNIKMRYQCLHQCALASGCRTSVHGHECDSEFMIQCHMRLRQRLHKINFWSQLIMVSGDKTHTPAVDPRVWQLSATYYTKKGSLSLSHTHTHTHTHTDVRQILMMRHPPDPHFSLTGAVSLHGLLSPPPPLALFTPASVCVISSSLMPLSPFHPSILSS